MRVTDLIPWTAERRNQPASRSGSDPVAMLQGNVNRAFDDFLRMFPIPVAGPQMLALDQGGAFQVDVTESDKEVKVSAELPGWKKAILTFGSATACSRSPPRRRLLARRRPMATSFANVVSVAWSELCRCPKMWIPMRRKRRSKAVF